MDLHIHHRISSFIKSTSHINHHGSHQVNPLLVRETHKSESHTKSQKANLWETKIEKALNCELHHATKTQPVRNQNQEIPKLWASSCHGNPACKKRFLNFGWKMKLPRGNLSLDNCYVCQKTYTSFSNGWCGHYVVNDLDVVRKNDQIEHKLKKLGPLWTLSLGVVLTTF